MVETYFLCLPDILFYYIASEGRFQLYLIITKIESIILVMEITGQELRNTSQTKLR